MERIWDTNWGYLARQHVAPVVLGEFGGIATGQDLQMQQALVRFMAAREIGGFWWSLNPESEDTGGLIKSWEGDLVPEQAKLRVLQDLPASHVPLAAQVVNANPPTSSLHTETSPAPIGAFVASMPPPWPPMPPKSPPPPFALLVRTPPQRPPPQPRPWGGGVASPPYSPSLWRLFGTSDAAPSPPSPTPPLVQPRGTDPASADDATWIIPGLLLGGWSGVAQLGMLCAGCVVMRWACGFATPSGNGELLDEQGAEGTEPAAKPARRKSGRSSGGGREARWQQVPSA